MIKRAEIKISSAIENLDESGLSGGDCEKNESRHTGYLRMGGGEYSLTYSEEEDGAKTSSEIKVFSDGRVSVSRSGAIESSFFFEEGATHSSLYKVPPYLFDCDISAKRVRTLLSESGGEIDLVYTMKIGGAEKSCRMKIWISTDLSKN